MPRSDPRTRVGAVRLSRGELAILRGRAAVAGAPLSSFLRDRALAHRVRFRGTRLTLGAIERLAGLGTPLNGFARAANAVRRIVGEAEVAELVLQIRAATAELWDGSKS